MRTDGQIFIGIWMDKKLADKLDEHRGRVSRSDFMRDAVVKKLQKMGVDLPPDLANPPDRTGKGGPKKTKVGVLGQFPAGTDPLLMQAAEDAAEYAAKNLQHLPPEELVIRPEVLAKKAAAIVEKAKRAAKKAVQTVDLPPRGKGKP